VTSARPLTRHLSRPQPLTRRTLLAAAAAAPGGALLAGCTGDGPRGSRSTTHSTDRPSTQEADIFDLTLHTTDRFRPFELLASGFVAAKVRSVAPGTGELTLHAKGPQAPFAAVEARLPAAQGSVALGLASDAGDHVLVRWSAQSSRVTLEVRAGGRTKVVRRRKLGLRGGARLAFALCENQVTALVDTGNGWQPVITERDKVSGLVDLRHQTTLSRYRYAWGTTGVTATSLRAGLFGMTGLRDPHLVQHADGSPYERDGRRFLTWTCAGLGFFQQAHWSAWSFDRASPRDMRLEAQLFSRRDGLVLGDHAGQLVRHQDRWLVATSSWGDFAPGNIHIRHAETDADLLSGAGRTPGVPLNRRGRAQLPPLAARAAEANVSAVYTSPLERAIETARAIVERCGTTAALLDPDLNEIDYGDWTGLTFAALSSREDWQHFNRARRTRRR